MKYFVKDLEASNSQFKQIYFNLDLEEFARRLLS